MENTKNLHIVVMECRPYNEDEIERIRSAVKRVTGKDLRLITMKAAGLVFTANAEYKELVEELDIARAPSTNVFIARLSEPCTTIGFSVLCSHLQEAGLLSRKK